MTVNIKKVSLKGQCGTDGTGYSFSCCRETCEDTRLPCVQVLRGIITHDCNPCEVSRSTQQSQDVSMQTISGEFCRKSLIDLKWCFSVRVEFLQQKVRNTKDSKHRHTSSQTCSGAVCLHVSTETCFCAALSGGLCFTHITQQQLHFINKQKC